LLPVVAQRGGATGLWVTNVAATTSPAAAAATVGSEKEHGFWCLLQGCGERAPPLAPVEGAAANALAAAVSVST